MQITFLGPIRPYSYCFVYRMCTQVIEGSFLFCETNLERSRMHAIQRTCVSSQIHICSVLWSHDSKSKRDFPSMCWNWHKSTYCVSHMICWAKRTSSIQKPNGSSRLPKPIILKNPDATNNTDDEQDVAKEIFYDELTFQFAPGMHPTSKNPFMQQTTFLLWLWWISPCLHCMIMPKIMQLWKI